MIGWFEQAYTERLRHEACRTSHDMIYPSWGPGVVMPFKRLVLVVVGVGGWTLPATPASILTDDPARNWTLPLYHTNQGGTVPESYTSCFSPAGTRLAAVVAGLELLSLAVGLPKGLRLMDGKRRRDATR